MAVIFGTRPEIIKLSSLIDALLSRGFDVKLIHSGQHYDFELSGIFIRDLGLPDIFYNAEVGSGTHAQQTARALERIEEELASIDPDLTIVQGDTNTALAGALASIKLHIPVAHVESGLRSRDIYMPEEINRILIDHCSQLLFAPSEHAARNLEREGIPKDRIFVTGNTIVDAVFRFLPRTEEIERPVDLDEYIVVTFHRAENVDREERLREIVSALVDLDVDFVLPLHPRAKRRLEELGLLKKLVEKENAHILDPLGYLEMLSLLRDCRLVVTDSGGLQEEAFTLRKPCVTLRYSTERVETIWRGANILVGAERNRILDGIRKMLELDESRIRWEPNPYGDGKAGERIASIIEDMWEKGKIGKIEPLSDFLVEEDSG